MVPKFSASTCLIFGTSNNFCFHCLYVFDDHDYLDVNILSFVEHLLRGHEVGNMTPKPHQSHK